MTLTAVAATGMRRIGDVVGPRRRLRPRLEAGVLRLGDQRARGDGVIADAHPYRVGFMAAGAAAGDPGMDLRVARRRRRKTAAWRRQAGIGGDQTGWHGSQMAALAGYRARDMRIRAGRRCRRHDHDAANSGKAAAGDRWTMAIGTAAAHARVIHLPAGEAHETVERRVDMAVAALRRAGARKMIGRHARCRQAVVTTGATAQIAAQHRMRELAHWLEHRGHVTGVAGQVGRKMTHRLSDRPVAVMAGIAGAGHYVDMGEQDRRKGVAVVTGIAGAAGLDMLVGHRHRPALVVHHMAARAITGGGLEDALDMAGLTAHLLMRPEQRKGRRIMIKAGASLGHDQLHHQQQAQRQYDLAQAAI